MAGFCDGIGSTQSVFNLTTNDFKNGQKELEITKDILKINSNYDH